MNYRPLRWSDILSLLSFTTLPQDTPAPSNHPNQSHHDVRPRFVVLVVCPRFFVRAIYKHCVRLGFDYPPLPFRVIPNAPDDPRYAWRADLRGLGAQPSRHERPRDQCLMTVPVIRDTSLKSTVTNYGVPTISLRTEATYDRILIELDRWQEDCAKPPRRGAVKVTRGPSRDPTIVNPIIKDARTLLVQLKLTVLGLAVVKPSEGLREDFYRAAKTAKVGTAAVQLGLEIEDPSNYETQLDAQEWDRPLEVIDHTTQLTMTPIHHYFRKQHFEKLKACFGSLLEQRNALAGYFRDLALILDREAAPFKDAMEEMISHPFDPVIDGRNYFIDDICTGVEVVTDVDSVSAEGQEETGSDHRAGSGSQH
ncbi:uncharacterized protein LOC62_01G000140 [Vanrija pseudolonga]|uniref:Uncharacterized protein n=1 Tax=Vanrija pseudolonga TaxID=143232 RepID=A0AAF1BHZ4_9TREE|nr:hypothetical protein LOC62_01G000140 [Vanrija pseudolonga]